MEWTARQGASSYSGDNYNLTSTTRAQRGFALLSNVCAPSYQRAVTTVWGLQAEKAEQGGFGQPYAIYCKRAQAKDI